MLNLARRLLSRVFKILLMKSGQKWQFTQAGILVDDDNPLNTPKNLRMPVFSSRVDVPYRTRKSQTSMPINPEKVENTHP